MQSLRPTSGTIFILYKILYIISCFKCGISPLILTVLGKTEVYALSPTLLPFLAVFLAVAAALNESLSLRILSSKH